MMRHIGRQVDAAGGAPSAGPSPDADRPFDEAFDNAAVGMAHVAPDGTWLRGNRRFAEILGHQPETLAGVDFRTITHPEDLERDLTLFAQILEGQRNSYQLDKRYYRPDGSTVWTSLTVGGVRNPDGSLSHVVAILTDITEKKQVEQALAESEARLRAVHQTSPDGFIVYTSVRDGNGEITDFRIEYINPASARAAGEPVSEIIGKTLRQRVPAEYFAEMFDIYVRVVDTGEPWQGEQEYEWTTHKAWYRITAAKVGDGFAVSFADITDAKRAETALQQRDEQLRNILDNVNAAIGLLTPEGIVLDVNEVALDSAGVQRSDVVGRPFWDTYWWSHDADAREHLKEAIAKAARGEAFREDLVIRCRGDARKVADFQLAPIMNEAGEVIKIVPSGVNITERVKSETHREMLVNELSHRVKNSLATVQTIASHTLREASDLEAFRETFIGRLMAISKCHDLLVDTTRRNADISQLVRDQVLPYAPGGGENRVRMAGPPLTLSPEASHAFGLVLHELATNAAKYGALSSEDGHLDIKWKMAPDPTRHEAVVTWVETGGPPVAQPTRRGFGSVLIEQSLVHTLGGHAIIEYRPEGLWAQFRFRKKETQ
ncbi:MAG: PAS domain S-box protein [Hyphomonas sp.]